MATLVTKRAHFAFAICTWRKSKPTHCNLMQQHNLCIRQKTLTELPIWSNRCTKQLSNNIRQARKSVCRSVIHFCKQSLKWEVCFTTIRLMRLTHLMVRFFENSSLETNKIKGAISSGCARIFFMENMLHLEKGLAPNLPKFRESEESRGRAYRPATGMGSPGIASTSLNTTE